MLGRGSGRSSRLARMRRRRSGGCWVLVLLGLLLIVCSPLMVDWWYPELVLRMGWEGVHWRSGSGSGSVYFFLFFVGSVVRA